jgi:hypothetical protein
LQLAVRLCLAAKALHRGEHIGLLVRERIAELLQPGQIVVHDRQHSWKRHQGLNARIPWLSFQRLHQSVAGQRFVCRGLHPSRGRHNFKRECRGHQKLRQQLVWIERHRS